MAIVTPIIHPNGDRKATLLENLTQAVRALRVAHQALQQCAPNGRNFYLEEGRFPKAQQQHWARMAALTDVLHSLNAEAVQIDRENPAP